MIDLTPALTFILAAVHFRFFPFLVITAVRVFGVRYFTNEIVRRIRLNANDDRRMK